MARVSIFLIVVALIGGTIGCAPTLTAQYDLSISSTEGGSVTSPGEGTGSFTYDEGELVNLIAEADEGYQFFGWTGDVGEIADVEDSTTTVTMRDDYSITATFAVKQYSLIAISTEGGSVTTPGEDAYTYDKGAVVNLVAVADEGYVFMNWTGDVSAIADVSAASTTIIMNGGYSITANFAGAIRDWYDLDAIRNNLDGSYVLMNDLDSTTAGYGELASPTANGGKGWEPIGAIVVVPSGSAYPTHQFTGSLDGQGCDIEDLFIDRADEDGVALFGCVGEGVIQNLGMIETTVAGRSYVGSVVGRGFCATVSNCYCAAAVSGRAGVGGLAGANDGTVSNSCSTGSVSGPWSIGGLMGGNWGSVISSYSSCGVTGADEVGGLVGWNHGGTVSNSYSTGSVTGSYGNVAGLVGVNHDGIVSNSYYNYDEVLINGRHIITIGALSCEEFDQWLSNDKFLDINQALSQEDGYYVIKDISDFKQLLAFGQDNSLKFKLENDLDLVNEANLYIPYLAGEFHGNGHKIVNLSFSCDFISQVGLFGYLAPGAAVTGVNLEGASLAGYATVGGLVGENDGTVSNSYSTGTVTGYGSVGGLVGRIGYNGGTVSNSHYSYDEVLINGRHIITIGALSGQDFGQWLTNDKFLDVNERLYQEDGYCLINDVSDFRQLLAFGQDGSLKFRLTSDLNLANEDNFCIPYLAGEFDGNGQKISNLRLNFDSVAHVGLFGYLAYGGRITRVGAENIQVTADGSVTVGGLLGGNVGTVSGSYSSGSVTGGLYTGGLVGWNIGTIANCYSTSSVKGDWDVGGLMGANYGDYGTVSNSYSVGTVVGDGQIGGLVGGNYWDETVSKSFWDVETSGQAISAGGTGKTTAEMKSIATFSGGGWSIIAVANPDIRNTAYTWNIVDGQTYPFLSWQS